MLRSSDLVQVQKDLGTTRLNERPVILRIPSLVACPDCGWDEYSQSAYDSQCATCEGEGRIKTWTEKRSRPRIQWVIETVYAQLASGGIKPGDCLLYIHERERYLYDEVMSEPEAYIEVDGIHLRPTGFNVLALGQKVEISVHCQRVRD